MHSLHVDEVNFIRMSVMFFATNLHIPFICQM